MQLVHTSTYGSAKVGIFFVIPKKIANSDKFFVRNGQKRESAGVIATTAPRDSTKSKKNY
jgi:hypothetical protein